jgi:predicted house-cleaning noncanonical NTP pyrophosphatase (MazG superfamily)
MEQWIIVRDRKPELPWRQSAWTSRMVIDDKERQMYLTLKIDEEIQEVLDANKKSKKDQVLEELWDVYEIALCLKISRDDMCHRYPVLYDIVEKYWFSHRDIENRAEEKKLTHGSFQSWILLDIATVEK